MKAKPEFPETLREAVQYFSEPDRCIEFMTAVQWPDGRVKCGRCGSESVYYMKSCRRFKCRACKNQFSVKINTIFEESPLGFDKWLPAVWMIINAKNGISSCEIARALGVTQKTAWFMLHRIRLALQDGSLCKFAGNVEVDETFIGGKARKMNNRQWRSWSRKVSAGPFAGKAPVQGILQRTEDGKSSRVALMQVRSLDKAELQGNIKEYVLKGSKVYTDENGAYVGLKKDYTHSVINHAVCYARGHVHTNGLENFWSLLKRTIKGTYVSVEPFHLFRYLDEQAFRFNERKDTDAGRFLKGILGVVGKRLQYITLIGQRGYCQPPTSGTRQAEAKEGKRRMKRKPFGGFEDMGLQPA
ncbi:MAG TPA: IS1595 family transposase [Verrucomicrobiae bacterium]|nr:IS1595 family transposase [Verrucomicrobiae bacterium]